MSYRTPLSNVRGLGSAKDGSSHFWWQRITGFANIFLMAYLLCSAAHLAGSNYSEVQAFFRAPWNLVLGSALILSFAYHMKLGMQVIIEDYVHSEGAKILSLVLNFFFSSLIALAGLISLFKLGFGV